MREYGFHRRVFSRTFVCFSQSKLLNMYDIDVPSHVCNLRIGERLFPHSLHVNDKVQPILNKRYKLRKKNLHPLSDEMLLMLMVYFLIM